LLVLWKVRGKTVGSVWLNPESISRPKDQAWCSLVDAYPSYYRDQAERARRLARSVTDRERAKDVLAQVAQEYDELAEDLECGAGEPRHSELLPRSNNGSR